MTEEDDRARLGYRLLLGVPTGAISMKQMQDALDAAQRHREYNEVDVTKLAERVMSDVNDGEEPIGRVLDSLAVPGKLSANVLISREAAEDMAAFASVENWMSYFFAVREAAPPPTRRQRLASWRRERAERVRHAWAALRGETGYCDDDD